jgi:hypothetical protein
MQKSNPINYRKRGLSALACSTNHSQSALFTNAKGETEKRAQIGRAAQAAQGAEIIAQGVKLKEYKPEKIRGAKNIEAARAEIESAARENRARYSTRALSRELSTYQNGAKNPRKALRRDYITTPEEKPETIISALSHESALSALLPQRGAVFHEMRAIARAMKSGAEKRGAPFNKARFSALVMERRAAYFGARIGALICHRLENGSPRAKIAKLTRARAQKKIRLVKLQGADKENIVQNVRALLISRDIFKFSQITLATWKDIYKAARGAIRPLVQTFKGADGIADDCNASAQYESAPDKWNSTLIGARAACDEKRAALVRWLVRAAINARSKDESRKARATFRGALKSIRAIATRAGSADFINSQTNDAQARASALAMQAARFREYIASGAPLVNLKSFSELPEIA